MGNSGIIIHIDNGTMVNIEETTDRCKFSMSTIQFPNPFINEVTIQYYLEKPSEVILKIYNSQGKQVDKVVNTQSQGNNLLRWDAGNCPSGVYYYSVETSNGVGNGKMILLN